MDAGHMYVANEDVYALLAVTGVAVAGLAW